MTKFVVIWDWDNTLADTKEAVLQGLRDMASHFHQSVVTKEELKNVMTEHRGVFWQTRFPDNMMDGINYYISVYPKYADFVRLFAGVADILDFIKARKVPQIVLSNKAHENLVREVKAKGVHSYFDNIVGSDEIHGGKPELRFAEYALQQIPYDQIILIGDGLSDMQMAKALGAVSICVGNNVPSDVAADYRVAQTADVLSVLHKILGANR